MNLNRMLVVGAAACVCLLSAPARGADALSAIVTNFSGGLHVVQDVPCDDDINVTTPVTGGRMAVVLSGIGPGGSRQFTLARMSVFFAGFSMTGRCGPFDDTETYDRIGTQLGRAVSFTAAPGRDGVYSFTIPKGSFLLKVAEFHNGTQEFGLKQPSQDVTGAIDLANRTMSMRLVLSQTIHFQAGCVTTCLIDEFDDGTLTADVSGTIVFPDRDRDGVPDRDDNCPFVANPDQSPVPTPAIEAPHDVTLFSCLDHRIGRATAVDVCDHGPVSITSDAPAFFHSGATLVTWTATDAKGRTATATQTVTVTDRAAPTVACTATHPLGTSFIVTGDDACGAPLLELGPYTIGNGEQIKIEEVGQLGVRLQNVVGRDGIRKFFVGKGEAVIVATDPSHNTSSAVCR